MEELDFLLGIDIGSTTAKAVVIDLEGNLKFSAYQRHNTETAATLVAILNQARHSLGNFEARVLVTGSAGLGVHEGYGLPFVQEVIASTEFVRQKYPQVRTLLDIGGEDAKIVFFDAEANGKEIQPDIRMNGACAGGTGAFIDQMATLLDVSLKELNALASQHTFLYPIASRCGVFAKTDVQNLLSREADRSDIAASIFQAVVWQTLATLARGREIEPQVLFAGGPLTFLPFLRAAFLKTLKLESIQTTKVEHPELLPAQGAALLSKGQATQGKISDLISLLSSPPVNLSNSGRLPPLFKDPVDFSNWKAAQAKHTVAQVNLTEVEGKPCFLGIDSGSTTTKLALVDLEGRLFFEYYQSNHGDPIRAVQSGLERVNLLFESYEHPPQIIRSTVTGYGEDLIRAAYGCDDGLVETIAHYRAACAFDPQVSFILDIGGQDMKAIFVLNGNIQRIEINEACSSGCGTFIETFAHTLGWTVSDFGQAACVANHPCDLGTRCTVFMNSSVKQALREGAQVRDISAGLAYAVVRNALHKVLKLTDTSVLGEHIVVQGGAFRNPSIHRALEKILNRPVICPDRAEQMGAYGAALAAREEYLRQGPGIGLTIGLHELESVHDYKQRTLHCRGCENTCTVTKISFPNANVFYSGNRCERIFTNHGNSTQSGDNLFATKRKLLFERSRQAKQASQLTVGIPRALNTFENFPFWCTLLVESGINVHLSDPSSQALYEKGLATIMSENICFPAKLLHGHVYNLIEARVDRIFYPMVFYEKCEFSNTVNCFNCPIVTGYPDVVRSAIDPQGKYGIPFDQPVVNFQDRKLLKQACSDYLRGLGVDKATIENAFTKALLAQADFKTRLRSAGMKTLQHARQEGKLAVVIAGHPYHVDPLTNHKIPQALASMGVDVLTEDSIPLAANQKLGEMLLLTQWEYLNRIYHAAYWSSNQEGVELVQLNSFGCGPDAFSVDEVREILAQHGKNHTLLRIDEIDSLGSARLRLRSMLEAWKQKNNYRPHKALQRTSTRPYRKSDRRKTIISPEFSRFCTPPLIRPLLDMGYNVEVVPPSDQESVQIGLKYTNNEICYPGIIVVGDIIKALQSGKYDTDEVIVGAWETGGQCRATSISCLVKKALVNAGFQDIPLLVLSPRSRPYNQQTEFEFSLPKYIYQAMLGMAYTDGLSALHHASLVRERCAGDTEALTKKYMAPFENGEMPLTRAAIVQQLQNAVQDFNRLSTYTEKLPKVGIVGEVYVKYNPFVNHRLAQWFIDQKIEVVLPGLLTFFLGSLVGMRNGVKEHLRRPDLKWLLSGGLHRYVRSFTDQVEAILQNYHDYPRHRFITEIAQTAKSVLSLSHQYGEGWLLAGEVSEFVRAGIENVVCLQPFGCIANHVVAKGVARRLKELHPSLKLLFLDLDAGISEVNYFNRLYFFAEQAQDTEE
jgi:predicted CoA-substrate-specific enzyme activase